MTIPTPQVRSIGGNSETLTRQFGQIGPRDRLLARLSQIGSLWLCAIGEGDLKLEWWPHRAQLFMHRSFKMKFSQLSLLNILLLITTAGALFALYSSQQRNRQVVATLETTKAGMESEIKAHKAEAIKLREEFGFLTIEDKTKIHAIAVPFEQRSMTWTYRVYLPEGNDYFAACKINDLPMASEQPKIDFKTPGTTTIAGGYNSCGIGISSGEYLITIAVILESNKYRYALSCKASKGSSNGTGGSLIADAEDKWPMKTHSFASQGVTQKQTIAPNAVPLILLDGRSFGEKSKSSNKSTEGIIAWIETVPRISE